MSNSPPYVSLELTEEEATALYRILTKEQAEELRSKRGE